MSVKTVAKVQLTVEIHLNQPWDEKASLGEIYRTAKSEALELARKLPSISIVGVPIVTAIAFEDVSR